MPYSLKLLGIATSHIGLIRSLYCSVFKESSLFKRLDYLTTSRYLLSSIFLKCFFEEELRGAAALAATGMMISWMAFCVNRFFEIFFGHALSGVRIDGAAPRGLWPPAGGRLCSLRSGGQGERFLRLTGPMGRRVLKFDGPSGRGLWIATLRQCL